MQKNENASDFQTSYLNKVIAVKNLFSNILMVIVLQIEPEDCVHLLPGPPETVPDQYLHQRGHERQGRRAVL